MKIKNRLRIVAKFIKHFFTARHTRGYGVHSPYLFHFTRFVLMNKHWFYVYGTIEQARQQLKKNHQKIFIRDFGTGVNREMPVSAIARKSLQQKKYAQLMFRIIQHYKFKNVLELGTSLGITTAYLAAASSKINCYTLEGSANIANFAQKQLKQIGCDNARVLEGNIDLTLNAAINNLQHVDFAYIDANHTYEATLRYFQQIAKVTSTDAIVVIDDIHWSPEMEKAWREIQNNSQVTSTIDLFQVGIVFFNPHLHKKHYKMRF